MDYKEKYLNNPHIRLDEKRKRQLGITTQDINAARDAAIELPDDEPETNKEVIIRKRRNARTLEEDSRSALPEGSEEEI